MTRAGFTLVELLITIGILALVLALAVPRFANPSRDTAAFGLQLAALLNDAASMAKNQQTGTCVTLDSTQYALTRTGASTPDQTLAIPAGVTPQAHPPICYDAFGRLIGAARTLRVTRPDGADAVITIDADYGNAHISR
ncbi:type II secretion system protein [Deinococcus aluminii]|uniref:Prepilin-type N-terminal cleavage/methylation domain-containing protein n=1 Tax=Deinococcus aluminii TaxID=1656885 RepID=A0ABP9XGD0_9DEIO